MRNFNLSKEAKKLLNDIEADLEKARILSVKEPMQLSDRVNLNNMIRGIQQGISGLREWIEVYPHSPKGGRTRGYRTEEDIREFIELSNYHTIEEL